MSNPTNNAAWLLANNAPLEVSSSPYPTPSPTQLLIKNAAIAINPVDTFIQAMGPAIFPQMTHPYVLGTDLSGTVVSVGSAITRFKAGDRILAFALGSVVFSAPEGAFQNYTLVSENLCSKIPDTLAFENAAVLPMGLAVAGTGLFDKAYLGLQYPSLEPVKNGKILLIWGGATSMSANAIQLAVAAGYEVVSTSSSKNFEYVKSLGASQVFDYTSKSVVEDLVTALEGKDMVGAFDGAGFAGAFDAVVAVMARTKGRKFVSCVQFPGVIPEGSGVEAKFIVGAQLRENEVAKVVFEEYVPAALEAGKFVAKPEPKVVGHGLEHCQAALDMWKAGVSAAKIVVTL